MPGHTPPHNPLAAAAQEIKAVARETKSPWFERAALIIMGLSAAVTTAIGAMQVRHMLRREMREEQREQERADARRSDAAPPPERPIHGATATAGMPEQGDSERRAWSRKEEHAAAHRHGHTRQR
jgi:hypothetical protein